MDGSETEEVEEVNSYENWYWLVESHRDAGPARARLYELCDYSCGFCGAKYPYPELVWAQFSADWIGQDQCCPKPVYGPPRPIEGLANIVTADIYTTYKNIVRNYNA